VYLRSFSDAAAASAKAGLSKSWPTTSTGSNTIGGLTDEDADAARPDFEAPETVRELRKNNVGPVLLHLLRCTLILLPQSRSSLLLMTPTVTTLPARSKDPSRLLQRLALVLP
jgi:hypothetical protein